MALVGDVIMSARELMTDLPPTLFGAGSNVAVATVAGASLPPGTYFAIVTFRNNWGETLSSSGEVGPLTIGGGGSNQAIQITANLPGPTATFVRLYLTYPNNGSGSEVVFTDFPVVPVGVYNLTTFPTNNGYPPTRNTAYLPDSDGGAVSATAIYRWLNQGLAWAAAKNRGGLPDFGAVGTTNGQPNYVMPGYWKKIDSAWFDGYPLGLLQKNNVYRRNPVPGYSGMLIVYQATDRLMVEAWPQPNRTSGQTTLASPLAATDTVANLTSAAGYVLGFGLTQIGAEIVNFAAVSGNQLTGLTRGMCGTVPAAAAIGTAVIELNLMIAGYRVPSTYAVGAANSTFYLPPGWDSAIAYYILSRFRKAEQDEQGAKAALDEAKQNLSDMSANRIIAGPRQISPYSAIGPEVGAGLGTAFGGVIIP
jgi:hypothetical protein